MMLVGARGHFSAGHKLPQHPAAHGHSYEVWVYVREGKCVEELQREIQKVCAQLDHKMLNDVFDDPTMERIARFFATIQGAERIEVARPVEGLRCEYQP